MRTMLTHIVIALVLAAAGGVCWIVGGAERRVALAREQLTTMDFAGAAGAADAIEPSVRMLAPVPGLGDGMAAALDADRATADYWLARYQALEPRRDASGAIVARDPAVLFIAANAAYRAIDPNLADRQALVQRFDAVIKSYGEVLKSRSSHEDAAYNYEFLVRQREQAARARGPAPRPEAARPPASIHGRAGAPPAGVAMPRFRILIPKRSDERQENIEPGKSDPIKRRG